VFIPTSAVPFIEILRYLPFDEAKKFVHSLEIKSQKEWDIFCKMEKGLAIYLCYLREFTRRIGKLG